MSANIRSNRLYPDGVVMNRWVEPIEAFVPNLECTDPITYSTLENSEQTLSEIRESSNSVVLAHETDTENAKKIVQNGFQEGSDGMSPIRTGAVFGWVFKEDIGKHKEYSEPECDSVVFFEAPKSEVYISSYSSSAYLLAMGMIDDEQYEKDYVMNYKDFLSTVNNKPSIIGHLNYDVEPIIRS